MGKMVFSIGTLSECIKVKKMLERKNIQISIVKLEERIKALEPEKPKPEEPETPPQS